MGYSSTGLIAQMRLNGNLWQQGVRARPAVHALQSTHWHCAHLLLQASVHMLPSLLSRKAPQLLACMARWRCWRTLGTARYHTARATQSLTMPQAAGCCWQ